MNEETKMKLASAGIDITEIIPDDCLVVPKALWIDWAEKIEQMGKMQQETASKEPVGARVPRARCERRVEARLDHIGDLICQLLAIKCHCARGDADLEALDAAIRWGLKRHRNQVARLVRKRNGPTIGDAGSEAPLPSTNYHLPTGEEAQS